MSYHSNRINGGGDSKNKYLNSKIFCDSSKTRKILLSTVTASLIFTIPNEILADSWGVHGSNGTTYNQKANNGNNGTAAQHDISQNFNVNDTDQTISISTDEQNNANGKNGQEGSIGGNGTSGIIQGYTGNRGITGYNGGKGGDGQSGGDGGNGNNLGNITVNAHKVDTKTDLSDKDFTLTLQGA
ncbi:hypothetical protein BGG37_06135, partial [Campylobacter lari]|nr:hypothetical protein [Campylobacter lari]